MTVAENIIRKLLEKREMVDNLLDDIEELESDLIGMEFKYKGSYAVVSSLDGGIATIYTEPIDGSGHHIIITLERLKELFGGTN